MNTVRIKKHELMAALAKNKSGHRKAFEAAFEGYRKECIAILESNLAMLKAGERKAVSFAEYPPQDHTADYDRMIAMLEMSVDDNIELTPEEFSQYIQDDWDWKAGWSATNMKYMRR